VGRDVTVSYQQSGLLRAVLPLEVLMITLVYGELPDTVVKHLR
jgi:hypothetical protein